MTHTFVRLDYVNATFQTPAAIERETAALIFVNQQSKAQKKTEKNTVDIETIGTMGTEGGRRAIKTNIYIHIFLV